MAMNGALVSLMPSASAPALNPVRLPRRTWVMWSPRLRHLATRAATIDPVSSSESSKTWTSRWAAGHSIAHTASMTRSAT